MENLMGMFLIFSGLMENMIMILVLKNTETIYKYSGLKVIFDKEVLAGMKNINKKESKII